MSDKEIIAIYEKALKEYALPENWVRGIVYNKRVDSRRILYGFEEAEQALRDAEKLTVKE